MSTVNCGKNIAQGSLPAGTPPQPPSWTAVVPAHLYHAAARSGAFLSASMLREFRLCPAMYRDIVAGRTGSRKSPALKFGAAAHKLILEGEGAYRSLYAVCGPTNPATGRSFTPESQTYARWLTETGLPAERTLTPGEDERLRRMRDAVAAHPEAARLLAHGWPERTVRAVWAGMACQARLDWLAPEGRAVDLKTVSDLDRFELDAPRFGYLNQFAFYRDIVREAGGGDLEMSVVAVEKKPPFRVGVWHFPAAVLAPAAERNIFDAARLARCRATGHWPTGYESPRLYPGAAVPAAWLN